MIEFDMTVALAPIIHGMVALLVLSAAAIAADSFGPSVVNRLRHFTRRQKPRIPARDTIIPVSA